MQNKMRMSAISSGRRARNRLGAVSRDLLARGPSRSEPPSVARSLAALNHDPHVAAWAGYHNLSVQIDGLTVPVLLGDIHAAVAPPVLSGHAVDDDNQIVLGAVTLSLLHKHLGDTVVFSFGSPNTAPLYLPPAKLVIVGTATLPAIGGASTIASQASAIAAIAAVVGVPIGIAIGRQLWILFARNINAVPEPTVPASLILVAAGALIFANLVAAMPARMAARTPAALVLRTE